MNEFTKKRTERLKKIQHLTEEIVKCDNNECIVELSDEEIDDLVISIKNVKTKKRVASEIVEANNIKN